MRKLIGTLVFLFVLYVVYYDLSQGTLTNPTSVVLVGTNNSDQTEVDEPIQKELETSYKSEPRELEPELYFQEVKVTAGQTVLSVVEQMHNGPIPVSISQLVADFQLLNPNVEPEKIQIGKVYKFPVYNEE
ncbi:hypothetical protein [Calidifontibacillus oryziterrae]|uniref:hypothetical protein n=1 Tax=Calidifontibacillus oryziterrae TaxID=1191699 RepID=UPI0002D52B4C|nr:hypothetical protein [Calidifontibacillus oryziterrae]